MAKQTVTVGNAIIALAGNNDLFNDGYITGYLEFYDERHRPLFPLTSHVIRDHLMMIINESPCSDLWRAGRVTGWIEALIENSPQTLRSFVPEERMTFLYEA
jgi:hypothetical protein